jgi:hypothetical protein
MLVRELSDAILHSRHLIDAEYLPAGLHESGGVAMRDRIQQSIDACADGHDYILIGYGLCGNGTAGLLARTVPLVLPRAHDCITLLTGGRKAFRKYFEAHPGTLFRSLGWVERSEEMHTQLSSLGVNTPLGTFVAQYGEDAGSYLYEQFQQYSRSYSRLTFIRTGLEPNDSFAAKARNEAHDKQWTYEELPGSLRIFHRMLSGDWADDFLIVPPRCRTAASYDENILAAVPGEANVRK